MYASFVRCIPMDCKYDYVVVHTPSPLPHFTQSAVCSVPITSNRCPLKNEASLIIATDNSNTYIHSKRLELINHCWISWHLIATFVED